MSDLLPYNATRGERAMAGAIARLSDVPVPVRPLWDPRTCPVELLPWLAWTLSVEAWDPAWPEELKRSVISNAVATARRKGTKAAVVEALAALGANAQIIEWWEREPVGTPHTFEVSIVGNSASVAMQNMMLAEIARTKPLRSHFEVVWGKEFAGSINIVGVLQGMASARLPAAADLEISLVDAVIVSGAGTSAVNGTYIHRGEHNGRGYYTRGGNDPSSDSITWWDDHWGIQSAGAELLYNSTDSVDTYPWDVVYWLTADGSEPVPTLLQSSIYV